MVCSRCIKPQSSTQKVARRQVKLHLKRIRDREYKRLRSMVPSIANKEKVSKVTVIEEAVKYIDYLHLALMNRFNSPAYQGSGKCGLVTEEKLKNFVQSMLVDNMLKPSIPTKSYEKQQKAPTYILKQKNRHI